MDRWPLAVLLVVLLVASCGDTADTTSTQPPPPTTATTTTTVVTSIPPPTATSSTTTVPPATTTTVPPATTTTTSTTSTTTTVPSGGFVVGDGSLFPPDALPGSDSANGSGCRPGDGDLPDGIWYGYVVAIAADEVDFDLACFFFGDAAVAAAAADGQEEPDNPYYIRNESTALRTVSVAPDAAVYVIVAPPDADLDFVVSDLASFTTVPNSYGVGFLCPGDFCGMWLYVNDGVATEIVEQYTP